MNRWGLYLTVVAGILFAIGVGGLNLLYRWRVRPVVESQVATQNRFRALYQEDQAFLAKYATELGLGISGGSADAGPYLNSRVLWAPALATVEQQKPVAIVDETTRVDLSRTGDDWIQIIAKGHKPKPDLSLFSELAKFDFWDIERGSPIEALTKLEAFVPPPKLPLPDTGDIIAAVKLRLIKGGLEKDYVASLRDVRQIGRLLMSTENLQLVLAGLLVFDYERRAYSYFVNELKFDSQLWTPIDSNVTRRARRAVLATRSYLRLWTSPEILQSEFLGDNIPPGLCAAVNEAIPFDFSLRRILEPHFPFEMDTRSEYARLDRIVLKTQTRCRLRYLTAILKADKLKIRVPGPFLFNDLPYSRKIFGLRLSSADLGGFEAYGKQVGGAANK